tara:strand:- start:894 stop:2522 length:1629 start_codon:yes stop_codon:yes gene_type:complete
MLLMRLRSSLFLIVLLSVVANVDGGERPNIVYVMADDLGIGDVSCFGGAKNKISTRHLDRLAAAGMRFTDAHSTAAVCVPSRVAIMTGRYAWRQRASNRNGPWGFLGPRLKKDQLTLGRLLRRAGYQTGYVGKWHLGLEMTTSDGKVQGSENVDYKKPVRFGPWDMGFDFGFILPGSLDMFPYAYVKNGNWVGSVTARKGWSAFNRVGPAEASFQDTEVLDTFSRQAEMFISRHAGSAKRGRPFFLYVALTAPHTPLSPSQAFQGKSQMGVYGDFVMETDDCVGRLMRALDEHGLTGNTLFVATSDHGAASYAGFRRKATPAQVHEMEARGHFPSGIYRGYKFAIYEGGHRVPLIVRWPGVVKAGSACDRLVGLNDLVATLADVTGAELKPDQAGDSISYLPLLRDPSVEAPRQTMIQQSTNVFAVRRGKWKLCIDPGCGAGGRHGNRPLPMVSWTKAVKAFGRSPRRDDLRDPAFVQLFNLAEDPTESRNLASENPGLVCELFRVLDDQVARGRSTPGPALPNDFARIRIHNRVPGFVIKR